MKLTCEDRLTIAEMTDGMLYTSDFNLEPCDPCLLNMEMRRRLNEMQADALKEIPEEYAQERFRISRDEMDYTHFEQMCYDNSEHSFFAYVILQTCELFRILDSEPSYGSPCETPHKIKEESE